MATPISEAVQASRERRHLDRLETLIDSIDALVSVFLVAQFPNPLGLEEQFTGFWDFLRREGGELVPPLIGLVLMVVYWLQNNLLFGYLERTDNKHAILALSQLFFVLLYLYTSDLLEPITALIALPFACIGDVAWNLSWLMAPVAMMLVVRRRGKKTKPDT